MVFARRVGAPGSPSDLFCVNHAQSMRACGDGFIASGDWRENIQVLRANVRIRDGRQLRLDLQSRPMLAYRNGKFYLEYLSNPFGEM
jgi:hypothetical protein